ncbi:hypothetical protein ACJJTC_008508 [Scirpophaga incertulas]
MQTLQSLNHCLLDENVLRSLTQRRVVTILDFLNEDIEKLSIATKLTLSQILSVRNFILDKYSAPIVTGDALLERDRSFPKLLPTGIKRLDHALNGGIPIGYISELCGLAGCGKTQFGFQLAINCVQTLQRTVLYIDTKGDFSAIRVQKILENCGIPNMEMAEIMFKIKIVRIWTMDDLADIIKKIKNKIITFKDLALMIVDSLPTLMFQYLGDQNKIGLALLNTFVNDCRYLCSQFQISTVCVNIQTRWIDQDVSDVDDDKLDSTVREAVIEKQNRCLGKYWQAIPTLVIILENTLNDVEDEHEINVTINKSANVNTCKKCVLKTKNGILF